MLRATCVALTVFVCSSAVLAQRHDGVQVPQGVSKPVNMTSRLPFAASAGVRSDWGSGSGSSDIDSLVTFSGVFANPGVNTSGVSQLMWPFTMVGSSPFRGSRDDETTFIGAPIVPVNIDLRNADGSPRFSTAGVRLVMDATQFVQPVLDSPLFSPTTFSSSRGPTQFTDAVQRAAFFSQADNNWHTILRPRVLPALTLVLQAGYRFATDGDGNLIAVLVDESTFTGALLPSTPGDTSSIMGAVESACQIRTTDLTTFLLPNTFVFRNGDINNIISGFHKYDARPGDRSNGYRERRYVMNYSSWVSPGLVAALFGRGFSDITALSHQLVDTFNDPFLTNATPPWMDAASGQCMNVLAGADVLDNLGDPTFPITMKDFTYHPQNVALLPWFAGVKKSGAIGGAFSYPDTTLLTTAAAPQPAGCGIQ